STPQRKISGGDQRFDRRCPIIPIDSPNMAVRCQISEISCPVFVDYCTGGSVFDTFEPDSFRNVNLSQTCATGFQFFLKFLRKFPGEKTARKRFFALVVSALLRSRRKNRSSGRQSWPCGLKLEGQPFKTTQ
ncbi:MAG: hypothetical protein II912_11495, partial [Clostridia bacterium]|nr:hypothetical protein [Clostridia bacterium]